MEGLAPAVKLDVLSAVLAVATQLTGSLRDGLAAVLSRTPVEDPSFMLLRMVCDLARHCNSSSDDGAPSGSVAAVPATPEVQLSGNVVRAHDDAAMEDDGAAAAADVAGDVDMLAASTVGGASAAARRRAQELCTSVAPALARVSEDGVVVWQSDGDGGGAAEAPSVDDLCDALVQQLWDAAADAALADVCVGAQLQASPQPVACGVWSRVMARGDFSRANVTVILRHTLLPQVRTRRACSVRGRRHCVVAGASRCFSMLRCSMSRGDAGEGPASRAVAGRGRGHRSARGEPARGRH
jgi:hypothetical protein